MPHVRQQLRAAAIAAVAAVPALSGRVTAARPHARNISDLPAAEVSVPSEEAERIAVGKIRRAMDLVVSISAASSSVEDDLDALAVSVENAVVGAAAVQAVVADIFPASCALEVGDAGETVPAEIVVTFAAWVITTDTDPETAIGV